MNKTHKYRKNGKLYKGGEKFMGYPGSVLEQGEDTTFGFDKGRKDYFWNVKREGARTIDVWRLQHFLMKKQMHISILSGRVLTTRRLMRVVLLCL